MRFAALFSAGARVACVAFALSALALAASAQEGAAPAAPAPSDPTPSCLGKARLRGQTFETGSAEIVDEVKPVLDEIASAIQHNCTGRKITIEGHTDTRGTPEANQVLSEQRAAAVKAYLVAHGIPAEQLETVGYGESRPISQTDHEMNRRITFFAAAP